MYFKYSLDNRFSVGVNLSSVKYDFSMNILFCEELFFISEVMTLLVIDLIEGLMSLSFIWTHVQGDASTLFRNAEMEFFVWVEPPGEVNDLVM